MSALNSSVVSAATADGAGNSPWEKKNTSGHHCNKSGACNTVSCVVDLVLWDGVKYLYLLDEVFSLVTSTGG